MSEAKTTAQTLDEAFPVVTPNLAPLGSRILVQVRMAKKITVGGIILPADTKDTERDLMQTAKVVALGPLAYHNRDTQELWPEGKWVDVGDFLRIPKYGGDRYTVPIEGSEDEVTFVIIDDHDAVAKITGDPLTIKAYI